LKLELSHTTNKFNLIGWVSELKLVLPRPVIRQVVVHGELGMETDTLLLTDVFENYREGIQKSYGLEPAHFYTAPALSWAEGLKYTKAKLEIPLDVDMHIFFAED
jgi:hypothetical protein